MTLIFADRVKETTITTGTGTLTLGGAETGYQSFGAGIGNSNTCYYCIQDLVNGAYEVGLGTLNSSSTTLARTTILASSNSNAAVSLAAGVKDVFVVSPAAMIAGLFGGTTSTVLHGNASGFASYGPVNLNTDVSGLLVPANLGIVDIYSTSFCGSP